MRRVRFDVVDGDIVSVVIDNDHSGINFIVREFIAMVDEVKALPAYKQWCREDMIGLVFKRTLEKADTTLSAQDIDEAVRQLIKICRKSVM